MRFNFDCTCGTCVYKTRRYIHVKTIYERKHHKKVGIFATSNDNTHVLLVQSCGMYWGPPKGSLEDGESIKECAAREFREETGIVIDEGLLNTYTRIMPRGYYYRINMSISDSFNIDEENTNNSHNDSTGVGWFSIDCIRKNAENGYMKINQHLRCALIHYLNININNKEYHIKNKVSTSNGGAECSVRTVFYNQGRKEHTQESSEIKSEEEGT